MLTASPIKAITRVSSTVKDLFVYLYDLSPLELDLVFILIKNNKSMTLDEVAEKVDRDKSTLFRSLQKFVGLGICSKETKTLKEGGYYHTYVAIDIESFKLETEKRVKELEVSFRRLLGKFENDMNTVMLSFYHK